MDNKIVDFTFGMGKQARAVLNMLDREPDFAEYKNGYYQVRFETRPWYNGRERGFVISMQNPKDGHPVLHIAVFEHRNSDSICSLKWETKNFYWNHPLEDEGLFEKAYNGKDKYSVAFYVDPGECGYMADWVYAQFKEHYKTAEKKEGAFKIQGTQTGRSVSAKSNIVEVEKGEK